MIKNTTVGVVVVIMLAAVAALAQTAIKLPKNNFSPQQDIELGLKGAAEVRTQFPVIDDANITRYFATLGDRLVAVAPQELKHAAFQYSFTPVNVKEINAFALPGGPMFIHRGLFDAAAGEGELVGVMAHELSHVLLRHGTANASKAQNPWLQLGQLAGQIGGAVVGGAAGSAIAQGSQFGLGTVLLRYSRDFEKQADLLGAQIMSRAGYDPRELGRMFETIAREAKSGSTPPQWMSSHPNPGNRTAYINKEAEGLTRGAPADTSGFTSIKTTFSSLPPAMTMKELASRAKGGEAPVTVGTPGQPVPPPAAQYRNVNAGNIVQAAVPENWTQLASKQAVRFVPQNGYGQLNGQMVFTHGIEFGVAKPSSRDLGSATQAWLNAVAQGNPELRAAGQQQQINISNRAAILTPLVNPSPLGGREMIGVYTMFLADGNLFYYMTVVPETDSAAYDQVFQQIGRSLKLTDAR